MPEPRSSTPAPAKPVKYRRRASVAERIFTVAFFAGLALFFVNYVLGGLDGTAYTWYQAQTVLLDFVAWRINVYVLVLVPGIFLAGVALRHCLPIIEIPIIRNAAGEVRVVRHRYRFGSLQVQDGEATWREGKYRAYTNQSHVARNGALGYLIVAPVERNVNEATLEVTYDTKDIPAYNSRTLHRRLQREVSQRIQLEDRGFQEQERL